MANQASLLLLASLVSLCLVVASRANRTPIVIGESGSRQRWYGMWVMCISRGRPVMCGCGSYVLCYVLACLNHISGPNFTLYTQEILLFLVVNFSSSPWCPWQPDGGQAGQELEYPLVVLQKDGLVHHVARDTRGCVPLHGLPGGQHQVRGLPSFSRTCSLYTYYFINC